MPERFECTSLAKKVLYKYSSFPFLFLTLLKIYWKFTVSWKFSGLVCVFVVNISYNSCISECISTKYLALNQDQLIVGLVIWVSVS